MKFHQYIALKEADQSQEIDAIFNQASADIKGLFDQLYKGTADMIKNYGRASLPEGLQKQILQDLARIAQKVKNANTQSNNMTDPRGPGQELPKSENITIDTFIKNIAENVEYVLQEAEAAGSPSIVQNLGSHGVGVGGKKAYDFKSVLNNTYRLVMDRMAQLKDAVLKHLGIIRDTHSKVLGLRNTTGNIRNRLGDLSDVLSNPPQPFKGNEEDKAQDSMIALASAANAGFPVKLVGQDGQEIRINPRSEAWKQQVLRQGHKHKIFTIIGPKGEQEEVNIGNPEQIHALLNSWGYSGTSKFVPTPVKKARALGLRDPNTGKVSRDEE